MTPPEPLSDGVLRRAPGTTARRLGEEVLLLRPGADAVLRLNRSAAEVWELLEEPAPAEDLVAALAHGHGTAAERVAADLAPLLALLLEQGVVEQG